MEENNTNLVIYTTPTKDVTIPVQIEGDTVWLTQKQMAELFQKDIRTINEHIRNVYKEGELSQNSTIRKFRIVQTEGSREVEREIEAYNLDVIISVGYRVKSQNGTRFRIWATSVLRDHILKGFTINQKRLKEAQNLKLAELEKAVSLLKRAAGNQLLGAGEARGLLKIITDYTDSWILLQQYDKGKLKLQRGHRNGDITYEHAVADIAALKNDLQKKKEASDLFGNERGESLRAIIGNLAQSFGGRALYPSLEEKSAHLLYFIIKDHPFTDGNKRIASLLFVWFLARNNYLLDKKGEKKINDNTLVALALLVAESKPAEKETMIKLITNLLYA